MGAPAAVARDDQRVDTSDPGHPASELLDVERQAALDRLRAAATAGAVTYQQLAERTGRAHAAHTRAELAATTEDLAAAPSRPLRVPAGKRWLVASIANEQLGGPWTAPHRLTAVAVLGDVTVDLRDAVIPSEQLSIHATALVGDVHLLVPPGATVEMSGVAVLGRKMLTLGEADHPLPVPILRVSAVAIIGDVIVATQPPRSRMRAWALWKHRKSGDRL